MTRQRRWQLRMIAAGRCRICGAKRGLSRQFCDVCWERDKRRRLEQYREECRREQWPYRPRK